MIDLTKEALRQQMLLRALWHDSRSAVVGGWLRGDPERWRRGLQAYQSNAGALAERALTAAFPTIARLLGAESFAALSRAYWHHDAPQRGDLAEWGGTLPAMIAADEQLASEPYLADMARLDWAVHRAERAADDDGEPEGLELLASADPATLGVVFRAGAQLVPSMHPIVTLWQAHRSAQVDAFVPVRMAFSEGRAETAWVARRGWRAEVRTMAAHEQRFAAALQGGASLGSALLQAGDGLDFEGWLVQSLRHGDLAAVVSHA